MISAKAAGRWMGALFLVQGALGYLVHFVLLPPVMSAPGGYLANAAASAGRVRSAVLLSLATGVIGIAIAVNVWRIVRPRSVAMALWFLAFAIAGLALLFSENAALLTMLSLSQEYAKAGAARDLLHATGLLARTARYWAHYVNLIDAGGMIFVLYVTLFRFALVPRLLAGFGVVATLMQIVAVVLPVLGGTIDFRLLAPLGVSQLALSVWLIARGFADKPSPFAETMKGDPA